MTSKRLSIYAGDPLERLVADRASDARPTTTVVNAVADRYLEIVRRCLPQLSRAEWLLCCDSLNGTITTDRAELLAVMWAGIADSIHLDNLADKWHVDGAALVARLRALSYPETVALVDTVERFWERTTRDGKGEAVLDAISAE